MEFQINWKPLDQYSLHLFQSTNIALCRYNTANFPQIRVVDTP